MEVSWESLSHSPGNERSGEAKGPLSGSGCIHLEMWAESRWAGSRGRRTWPTVDCVPLFQNTMSFSLSLNLSSREFARWKVNNLALERRDFFSLPLPLAPEFIRNIRLLGRRPNLQQVTENLIKKYGTHFLLSATLGGKQHHDPAWIVARLFNIALRPTEYSFNSLLASFVFPGLLLPENCLLSGAFENSIAS